MPAIEKEQTFDPAMQALRALLAQAGLPAQLAERVTFSGADDLYATRFQAGTLTAVALAAAALARPGSSGSLRIDLDHAALMSEGYRHVRLDGAGVAAPRDPLTGFYATRDGREIFLHLNFPHHRARALACLRAEPSHADIAARVLNWNMTALDDALAACGAVAAPALRFAEWDASPQAQALAQTPLIEIERIGESAPEPLPSHRSLEGVEVIDFTRVLAGPTCGRVLAEAGAHVTRIEHPVTPDLLSYRLDANRDKDELTLDLRRPEALARLHDMSARADVFVQAYRPGVAAQFGLAPEVLCARRPGLVCATLSAYGHAGPFAGRRGFDSVIQAAGGLACAQGKERAHLLPTSPLDYGAGLLLAFGVEIALQRRATQGGSYRVRTSLARIALWLRAFQHEHAPTPRPGRVEELVAQQACETLREIGLIRHLRSAMTNET